jgi:hypothetical protein
MVDVEVDVIVVVLKLTFYHKHHRGSSPQVYNVQDVIKSGISTKAKL